MAGSQNSVGSIRVWKGSVEITKATDDWRKSFAGRAREWLEKMASCSCYAVKTKIGRTHVTRRKLCKVVETGVATRSFLEALMLRISGQFERT